MNNEERFLAVIFNDDSRNYYPYVWRREEGETQQVHLAQEIQNLTGELGEKPKRILNFRFGLEDGECKTQKEIGREYGVTGARIGQIIHRSLFRLRHPTRSHRLREFMIPSPEERFREKEILLDLRKKLCNFAFG